MNCDLVCYTFIPKLVQHLRHVDADFLRIILIRCTDEQQAVW